MTDKESSFWIISTNWDIRKLWEICDILDSQRKPITQKDRIKWSYPYYWASWVLDYVADYIFDEDLILIWEDWAKRWALDNSAFKVSWKVWVNNHAHVIRPYREKILDDFLVYFLVASDLSDYITGTTVPKLNQERLRSIQIPLPPLATQKAIVAKLDQIFAELDQTKSEIQKNLDNTDELLKSTYDLKIEELKEKYWLKKLEEICSLITDWSHFSPKTTTKWLPYITVKDIDDEWNIDTENSKKISEEDFAVLVQNWCQPKKWDVLYSKDWTIWKIHLVNDENFVVLSSLAIIRPWKDVKSEYLYQIFHSNFFEKQAVWNKTGAAIKRIVLKTIKSLQIPVPLLSEQGKIVEHLDQVSKEMKALKSQYQSQLDNLEELKKSVLDKAFRWELL